jgi:hypothetical protein
MKCVDLFGVEPPLVRSYLSNDVHNVRPHTVSRRGYGGIDLPLLLQLKNDDDDDDDDDDNDESVQRRRCGRSAALTTKASYRSSRPRYRSPAYALSTSLSLSPPV